YSARLDFATSDPRVVGETRCTDVSPQRADLRVARIAFRLRGGPALWRMRGVAVAICPSPAFSRNGKSLRALTKAWMWAASPRFHGRCLMLQRSHSGLFSLSAGLSNGSRLAYHLYFVSCVVA